ncbi:MAG: hypothetical protein L0H96_00655 [Humibacillus sp.]|nr:hypothetical protein [Humibacillus sp.]MDN5775407.1 hypothetical protein [Humibacillus sp.]
MSSFSSGDPRILGADALTVWLLLAAAVGGAGLAVVAMQARSRRTPAD